MICIRPQALPLGMLCCGHWSSGALTLTLVLQVSHIIILRVKNDGLLGSVCYEESKDDTAMTAAITIFHGHISRGMTLLHMEDCVRGLPITIWKSAFGVHTTGGYDDEISSKNLRGLIIP